MKIEVVTQSRLRLPLLALKMLADQSRECGMITSVSSAVTRWSARRRSISLAVGAIHRNPVTGLIGVLSTVINPATKLLP